MNLTVAPKNILRCAYTSNLQVSFGQNFYLFHFISEDFRGLRKVGAFYHRCKIKIWVSLMLSLSTFSVLSYFGVLEIVDVYHWFWGGGGLAVLLLKFKKKISFLKPLVESWTLVISTTSLG